MCTVIEEQLTCVNVCGARGAERQGHPSLATRPFVSTRGIRHPNRTHLQHVRPTTVLDRSLIAAKTTLIQQQWPCQSASSKPMSDKL